MLRVSAPAWAIAGVGDVSVILRLLPGTWVGVSSSSSESSTPRMSSVILSGWKQTGHAHASSSAAFLFLAAFLDLPLSTPTGASMAEP